MGHQRSSWVIRGHQRSSEVISEIVPEVEVLAALGDVDEMLKETVALRTKRSRAISTQSVRNPDAIRNAIKAYLQLHLDHGALLLLGELLEIHLRSRGQLGRQRETIRGRSLEGASQ